MKLKLKELNTGTERSLHIRKLSKKQRSAAVIAGTLAAVFLLLFVFASVGILPTQALAARIETGVFGKGRDFPVKLDSESIINMSVIGKNLCILSDSEVKVLDSGGNVVCQAPHTFSKPSISINGDRGVAFDRDGKGYILLTDKKIVSDSGTAPGTILAAEYGKDGTYAISTRAEGALSALWVYNRHAKSVFVWKCASEHISAITLSDNGRYAGVAALGTKDGDVYTAVHYFGFSYSEALNSATLKGTAAFDIDFSTGNTLTVFGDDGIYKLKKKGDEPETVRSFYSGELNAFSVADDGSYVLSLAKYGSTNDFEIILFSASGKEKRSIPIKTGIENVSVSDNYIFALAEKEIMVYNLTGKQVGSIEVGGELYGLYPTDRYCYIYSLDALNRSYSYGNSSVEIGYSGY